MQKRQSSNSAVRGKEEQYHLLAGLHNLSERQRKIVKLMLAHPNMSFRQMCIRAGYSPSTCPDQVKKQLTGKLGPVFAKIGITEATLARKVKELLNAKKVTRVYNRSSGQVETFIDENYTVQLAAVKSICLLAGLIPDKSEVS